MTTTKRLILAVPALLALWILLPSTATAGSPIKLEVLSSKANRVTGGDALVAVTIPKQSSPGKTGVRLNGKGVKRFLSPAGGNKRYQTGVVSGFRDGNNRLSAWAKGLRGSTTLEVYNSPITGPVFSGPHQTPYYCNTEALGAGPTLDADCSAATTVSYKYRSTGGGFNPLPDPTVRPADLAQTTTRAGQTVDYVVRTETGTVNRAVYEWSILAANGEMANGWNGRFVYRFAGGCGGGHQQGASVPNTLNNAELSRGYAVLTSSLNVFKTSCNDVTSAESAAMVKELVIESLGQAPAWTIGQGGSGGSVQIQMMVQNYPGILDGINPSASFPDNSAPDYPDCTLLSNYFETPDGAALSNAERRAITGLVDPDGCLGLKAAAPIISASEGCISNVVPPEAIFNPVTNPAGIRCSLWDNMVNIYGTDPSTGYARRSYDNTGTTYGLEGLRSGGLSLGQFLDLNQGIGGLDNNGDPSASRALADPDALKIAYRTGRINQGAGGFTSVPIVDERKYQDDEINPHQYLNTYRLRARLDRFNGSHGNQVMFRALGGNNVDAMGEAASELLARWLDAIAADDSSSSAKQKVLNNKPADAVDACWIGGERINGVAEIGAANACQTTYAPHGLPVNQAGAPIDYIAMKCQLKPVNAADFGTPGPGQLDRLNQIFPSGVCDYPQPGPEEQTVTGTDISFGPEQKVDFAKRKLFVKTNKRKVRKSKRGSKVKLTATLYPCPAVTWQRVIFERKVRKGKKMVWVKAGSKIVNGSKCRATTRVKKIRNKTRLRARAEKISGFYRTFAKPKTVRVKG